MIQKKISKILGSATFRRYIIVGLTAYVAEIVVIFSLKDYLNLSDTVSVAIAFWIGLVVSFVLQKFATFKNNDTSAFATSSQVVTYALLVIVNYLFTLAFVGLANGLLGVYVARTIALGVTTTWNYFIYKRVVFAETAFISPRRLRNIGYVALFLAPLLVLIITLYLQR
jgi:putative flippase GtrA